MQLQLKLLRGMKALDEAICEARSVVSMSPTSSVNLSSETILYASETQREDTPVSTNNKPVHNSQRKRKLRLLVYLKGTLVCKYFVTVEYLLRLIGVVSDVSDPHLPILTVNVIQASLSNQANLRL
ncbi:hypothetical protein Avbf_17331 [Armadillidium vulgare]|nr:hypothetical protein Avbf_17331 [Armadillidium vulgare]